MCTATPAMHCIDDPVIAIGDNKRVERIDTLAHPIVFLVQSWGQSKRKNRPINQANCALKKVVVRLTAVTCSLFCAGPSNVFIIQCGNCVQTLVGIILNWSLCKKEARRSEDARDKTRWVNKKSTHTWYIKELSQHMGWTTIPTEAKMSQSDQKLPLARRLGIEWVVWENCVTFNLWH